MKLQGVIFIGFLLWSQGSLAQAPIRKLTQRNIYLNSEINAISQCEALNANISIRSIFIDKNNIKYLATKNQGVVKLKDCTSSTQSILDTPQSYFIDKDPQGNIWVATSGNQLVNITQEKFIDLPIQEGEAYINFVHFTKEHIWVGTLTHGLLLLDTEGKKPGEADTLANIIQNQLNTRNSEIYDLYVDREHNIWLATGKGLFKINMAQNEGNFITSLKNKVIKTITGDQECIWFSTLGELWKLNHDTDKLTQAKIDPRIGVIEDLIFDHNHQLWIAGDVVVHYQSKANITAKNARVFDSDDGFESRKAICLAVDQNNIIWVGTSGSGVYMVQNDSHRPLNINYIQSFQQTAKGLVSTDNAQQVNVLQIGYTTKNELTSDKLSDLSFVLYTPTGKKAQLIEIGIPENYENESFTRNFKISGIDQLSPGLYTLKILSSNQEIAEIDYKLN